MNLKPPQNGFIFQFLDTTRNGLFVHKNKGNIIIPVAEISNQGNLARWVKVISIGSKVSSFKEGDIVLVEPVQWTMGLRIGEEYYWNSDETKVLAIGHAEDVVYEYDSRK